VPELPEVEICARKLRAWLAGRRIVRAAAVAGTPLRNISPLALVRGLRGRRIEGVDRRGKQLFIHLDGDLELLVHLGMTGAWERLDTPPSTKPKLTLELDDGARVAYFDPRRFGRVRLLPRAKAQHHPEIAKLGPDALEVSRARGGLAKVLAKSRAPIKLALMDQQRLAGVGNIYASEALFDAKVDPRRKANTLSSKEMTALARGLRRSFERTIAEAGDDFRYLSQGGENTFRVYGRAGEPCPRCKTPLRRLTQGGRGTFFCPRCQR
jgi:formamidopyrimidine-DNA glycosylase